MVCEIWITSLSLSSSDDILEIHMDTIETFQISCNNLVFYSVDTLVIDLNSHCPCTSTFFCTVGKLI